jgi:hypothetical protein
VLMERSSPVSDRLPLTAEVRIPGEAGHRFRNEVGH